MKKLLVASHYFRFLTQPRLRRIRGLALLLVLLASAAGLALWTRRAAAFANNLGSWGTAGSGDGQFAGPLGVAIDLVGNVYVVDSGNNRIQKFNTSGTSITKWGAAGSGNGQFNNPAGIAVDPAGNVYVADTFNNRIQQFTSAGVFVSKFGQSGAGEGQFQHPYAVAADRVGNLYVADSDNHRIEKFDTSGNFLLQWGGHGTGNGLFDNPRGVAVDVSGNVYITDVGNNRVQKFGSNGNYLTQWGANGTNPGQFGFVAGVVVDTMGYVYVTDASNNNVQKFTSNGAFASKLDGNPGSPLNTPFGCAVDTLGNLYVSNGNNKIVKLGNHGPEMYWTLTIDQQMGAGLSIAIDKAGDIYATDGGYQVLKFHPDGTFVTTWGGNGNSDGQFAEPFGIAFDSVGNVYVTDVFRPQVQVFTPDGVYVRKFAIPGGSISRGIAIDRFDNVYIADEGTNSVRKLTNTGSLIVEWGGGPQTLGVDGKFYTPQGVAIDYAGNVYVTDLGNNRVQVFDESGNFLSKFGSKGTGNGQMFNARGLGVDLAGNIYLADTINSRAEKFTPVGVSYETWGDQGGRPGEFHGPFGAAADALGNVYVMDTQNGRIQKFSQGAPVANAGSNQLFNCVKTPTQSVTLDASGTTDLTPNDTREYQWSEGTTYLGSGQTLTYSFPTGPEHIVTLVVTDGDNYSSTATVHLKVNAYDHATCNTAPVANDDNPAAINEDNLGTTISVLANDTDYDNDSLTVTSFTAPAHGSAHIGGGSTIISYTPTADYFGSDSFTYSISDGHGGTAQATVNLTINPVNDTPSFTKGANQTVNEDSGAQTVVGWATNISKGPANESDQTVDFIVTNDDNALFSVQPAITADGTLTYTPAPDANGHTNVTVKIHDDGGGSDTSPAQIFSITVNAVNDPPSFVKGADQNINEDAGLQTVTGWATSISQGPNEFGQKPLTFNVTVTGTTGNLTFGAAPAIDGTTGTLTYAVNNGTNGTASVSVTLTDSGSNVSPNVNTSAAQSFQINVGAINDPPLNTVPGPLHIPQDTLLTFSGSRTVSVSDLDAAEAPSDGVITVSLTATNGTLKLSGTAGLSFTVGDGVDDPAMTFAGTIPAINAALNGMTFAPTRGFNGTAGVEILTSDQGKTGSGGVQTDDDTISITVDPLAAIYLNEVAFNPDSSGQNEYLEFRSVPNSVIPAGTYFVVVDGSSGQLGNVK
ncbi:MAG TPA: tandem-95 repeat protein, partial [Pyrinomonadaceae bacterium]|nr:tandem-95 repeat protein [Pyrinomonadaceae bacterium]